MIEQVWLVQIYGKLSQSCTVGPTQTEAGQIGGVGGGNVSAIREKLLLLFKVHGVLNNQQAK